MNEAQEISRMKSNIGGYEITILKGRYGVFGWAIYRGTGKKPIAISNCDIHSREDARNEANYFITCLDRAKDKTQ